MTGFGLATGWVGEGRERSLVPPEKPDGVISVERGEETGIERRVFVNYENREEVSWWPTPVEHLSRRQQEWLEDAYLLGLEAGRAEGYGDGHRQGFIDGQQNGFELGYGKGVFDGWTKAYGRKSREAKHD